MTSSGPCSQQMHFAVFDSSLLIRSPHQQQPFSKALHPGLVIPTEAKRSGGTCVAPPSATTLRKTLHENESPHWVPNRSRDLPVLECDLPFPIAGSSLVKTNFYLKTCIANETPGHPELCDQETVLTCDPGSQMTFAVSHCWRRIGRNEYLCRCKQRLLVAVSVTNIVWGSGRQLGSGGSRISLNVRGKKKGEGTTKQRPVKPGRHSLTVVKVQSRAGCSWRTLLHAPGQSIGQTRPYQLRNTQTQ
jgi:hypothetical protein